MFDISMFAKQALASVAANATRSALSAADKQMERCDIRECDSANIGVKCFECGRKCCGEHIYYNISNTLKPKAFCISCIPDRHPDIFED